MCSNVGDKGRWWRVTRRELFGAIAAFSLVAALPAVAVVGAAAGSNAAAAPQGGINGKPVTITLITGDRVTLDAHGNVQSIKAGPGRSDIDFFTSRHNNRLRVIPSDAGSPMQRGVVDPRFFDITLLLQYGYDDARRSTMPVLVRGVAGVAPSGRSTALGVQNASELPAVQGFGASVDKRQAHLFWAQVKQSGANVQRGTPFGTRLWLDGKRQILLDRSVPQIGAPVAWTEGLTGRGVKVAVLDTGVDMTHPDLAHQVIARANFTSEDNLDRVGHGTHVASTIAGTGAASDGKFKGVAYGARLLIGKVCDVGGCSDSAILAGMHWAAAKEHARVINMSLGAPGTSDIDPLEEAVETLSKRTGALFVIAAGNDGCSVNGTVSSPSTANAALSVGAVGRDGSMASFSSCGPRQEDFAVKPEITAPGVGIVAAHSSTGEFPATTADGFYTTLSGTSMATPHVAGAATIVAQQHPDWTGAEIKASLVGTASPTNSGTAYKQGTGRVNVAAAVAERSWFDESANLLFGIQRWPHSDDALAVKRLTYRNTGKKDVTLNLYAQALSRAGVVAPPGMFYLSTNQLIVPAGGSASVNVLANTAIDIADDAYAGEVVASDDRVTVKSLFGIYKEVESYDLHLSHVGRDGQPSSDYLSFIDRLDAEQPSISASIGADGKATVRLPKGRYRIFGGLSTPDRLDFVGVPSMSIEANASATIDATRAKPWKSVFPDGQTVQFFRQFEATNWHLPIGTSSVAGAPATPSKEVRIGRMNVSGQNTAGPFDDFAFNFVTSATRVSSDGSPADNVPRYSAAESVRGTIPVGFTKIYRQQDFAELRHRLPAQAGGMVPTAATYAEIKGGGFGVLFFGDPGDQHNNVIRYVNADANVRWRHDIAFGLDNELVLTTAPAYYTPGREYALNWTRPGPYSPTLNPTNDLFFLDDSPDIVFGDVSTMPPPAVRRPSTTPATDVIFLSLQPFGDVHGDSGSFVGVVKPNSKRVTVQKAGRTLFTEDSSLYGWTIARIPAEAGRYTITMDVKHVGALGRRIGLPSRSTTVWSFDSQPGVAGRWTALPMSVIRLGSISAESSAPASTGRLSVDVQRQATGGAVPDLTRSLSVELSDDEGASWHRAELAARAGSTWVATVPNAYLQKKLSVRAAAVSEDGSRVQETLINVYPATTAPAP